MATLSLFKSLLSSNNLKHTQSSDNQFTTLAPIISTHHRALDILEVLEAIFAFVDHETLLTGTRLVCRSWYPVSKRFLRRELFFQWPKTDLLFYSPTPPPPSPPLEPWIKIGSLWKMDSAPPQPVWPRRRGEGHVYDGIVDMDPEWLAKLPRATALHLLCDGTQMNYDNYWGIWRAILIAISKQAVEGQAFTGHRYQRGLEEFRIEIKHDASRYIEPRNLFSCLPPSTLTSLHIEVKRPSQSITLDMLMTYLPNLQVFYASSGGYYGDNFFALSEETILTNPGLDPQGSTSSSAHATIPKTTKLRSISLISLAIAEKVLREFIERSPQLQELHLQGIQAVLPDDMIPWRGTNRAMIEEHIHRWTPLLVNHPNLRRLKSIKFSMRGISAIPAIDAVAFARRYRGWMHDISCDLRDLEKLALELGILRKGEKAHDNVDAKAITIDLLHEQKGGYIESSLLTQPTLDSPINRLTSLELLPTSRYGLCGSDLHRLMCAAPGLIHLRAKGVRFAVEDMDVYGQYYAETIKKRLAMEPGQTPLPFADEIIGPSSPPSPMFKINEIWACRGLKTLYLEFYTRSGRSKKTGVTSFEDPVHARVVFGYLSRVTPLLSDLCMSIGAAHVRLESGFCLLSRLRHLETLMVRFLCGQFSETLNDEDLSWMTVGGLSKRPLPSSSFYRPLTDGESLGQITGVVDTPTTDLHRISSGRGSTEQLGLQGGWVDNDMRMVGTLADVDLALDQIREQDRTVRLSIDSLGSWATTVATAPFSKSRPKQRWPKLRGISIRTSHILHSNALLEKTSKLAGVAALCHNYY